jgi:hypothetical protein
MDMPDFKNYLQWKNHIEEQLRNLTKSNKAKVKWSIALLILLLILFNWSSHSSKTAQIDLLTDKVQSADMEISNLRTRLIPQETAMIQLYGINNAESQQKIIQLLTNTTSVIQQYKTEIYNLNQMVIVKTDPKEQARSLTHLARTEIIAGTDTKRVQYHFISNVVNRIFLMLSNAPVRNFTQVTVQGSEMQERLVAPGGWTNIIWCNYRTEKAPMMISNYTFIVDYTISPIQTNFFKEILITNGIVYVDGRILRL